MTDNPYLSREPSRADDASHRRWLRHDAALWVRPDAARFLAPGADVLAAYPALAKKYNPNQPRVPAGNSDGGRWTDGEGGSPINDPRVISDADPDSAKPGEQYAQAGGRRSSTTVRINGQNVELSPGQAARLEIARSRAEDATARVREIDPQWKPQPSAYQSAEGLIRAYESDAIQAQARASELASRGIGPGPFAAESIPARGPERNFTAEERKEINRIGAETGCNTCRTREPGTTSGNFVVDHQLPSALNNSGRAQRLYPQCLYCSLRQGGNVRSIGEYR